MYIFKYVFHLETNLYYIVIFFYLKIFSLGVKIESNMLLIKSYISMMNLIRFGFRFDVKNL